MRRGGNGGFTKEVAKKGYENSIAKFSTEKLKRLGKKSYEQNLKHLNHSENARKAGLKNKGKKKTEAHKEALRLSWIKKKMQVSSNG